MKATTSHSPESHARANGNGRWRAPGNPQTPLSSAPADRVPASPLLARMLAELGAKLLPAVPSAVSAQEMGATARLQHALEASESAKARLAEARAKREKAHEAQQEWAERRSHLGLRALAALNMAGLIAVAALCVGNAARFAVQVTDSWIAAVLFVGILPVVAIGFEYFIHGPLAASRRWIESVILLFFLASAGAFIWSLADHFARERSVTDSSALLQGEDYRLLFISQAVLELTASYAFFGWMRRFWTDASAPRRNPLWETLHAEIAQLDREIGEQDRAIGDLKGQLAEARARQAESSDALLALDRLCRANAQPLH